MLSHTAHFHPDINGAEIIGSVAVLYSVSLLCTLECTLTQADLIRVLYVQRQFYNVQEVRSHFAATKCKCNALQLLRFNTTLNPFVKSEKIMFETM